MLLELIIVVAIVGILSAVAMPDILGMTNDAKAARIQADLSAIGTASEMYYVKNGEYPTALSLLVDTTGANGYLKKIPEPPDKSVTYTMGSKGEVTAVFNFCDVLVLRNDEHKYAAVVRGSHEKRSGRPVIVGECLAGRERIPSARDFVRPVCGSSFHDGGEGPFSAAIFALLPRDGGQADGVYFGRLERASSSLRSSDFV